MTIVLLKIAVVLGDSCPVAIAQVAVVQVTVDQEPINLGDVESSCFS